MQCVVLAGGLATRMRPMTETIPKSLLPVGDRPFLDYQLRYFGQQGIRSVVLCVGYKGEMIREYAAEGRAWSLNLAYSDEGKDLKGTGGALRLAFDAGLLEERFFVVYGDSFLPIDYREVWSAHRDSGMPALMTVMENGDRWDTSNAVYSEGRVTLYDKKLRPKPATMRYIDYGLSVLEIGLVKDYVPEGAKVDLADVLRDLSLKGQLAGFPITERFYEIGSMAGLEDFRKFAETQDLIQGV